MVEGWFFGFIRTKKKTDDEDDDVLKIGLIWIIHIKATIVDLMVIK